MQRRKLFLTASSVVLAIGAFAASKAVKFAHPQYYYVNAANQCVTVAIPTECTSATNLPVCQTTDEQGNLKTIFETKTSSLPTGCVTPLRRIQ